MSKNFSNEFSAWIYIIYIEERKMKLRFWKWLWRTFDRLGFWAWGHYEGEKFSLESEG